MLATHWEIVAQPSLGETVPVEVEAGVPEIVTQTLVRSIDPPLNHSDSKSPDKRTQIFLPLTLSEHLINLETFVTAELFGKS